MSLDPSIATLDLECVAYKVCRDEGWSVERVDRVEREYRAFWQLIRNSNRVDQIAPTREIDVYWHHHILDTAKYIKDCEAVFGGYLHHYPYSGIFSDEDGAIQSERVARSVSMIRDILFNKGTSS